MYQHKYVFMCNLRGTRFTPDTSEFMHKDHTPFESSFLFYFFSLNLTSIFLSRVSYFSIVPFLLLLSVFFFFFFFHEKYKRKDMMFSSRPRVGKYNDYLKRGSRVKVRSSSSSSSPLYILYSIFFLHLIFFLSLMMFFVLVFFFYFFPRWQFSFFFSLHFSTRRKALHEECDNCCMRM